MKTLHFSVLLFTMVTLTLAAQTDPMAARRTMPAQAGPTSIQPKLATPPDLNGLAIRFAGTLASIPIDVTVTSAGASTTDASLNIRITSVTKNGDGYLVNYVANHLVPRRIGEAPSSILPSSAVGWIVLNPGQPVNVVKSATTDLTLTLTELAK